MDDISKDAQPQSAAQPPQPQSPLARALPPPARPVPPLTSPAASTAGAASPSVSEPASQTPLPPATPAGTHAVPPPPPPPPAPSAAQGGRRWGCLIAVAVVVVLGLGMLGLGVWVVSSVANSAVTSFLPQEAELLGGGGSGPKIREEMMTDDKTGTTQKIAVIDVKGLLVSGDDYGSAGTDAIIKGIEAAHKDRNVVAIILDMDTPGGGVVASEEVHHAVQQFRDTGRPVVTCMHSVGASGYLIAAGTDHIIANRLTLTGSVGVIVSTVNYAGLFEKIGLRSDVYKSGSMKDLLHGGRERTPEEIKLVDDLVRANFEEFAAIVADGRARYADVQDVLKAEFADGRVLTGKQALDMGLVDELGYFEDAVKKAKELAGVSDAKVVRFRRAIRLFDLFSMRAGRFDGLSRLMPAEMRLLKPGQMYYVMPSAVP